MAAYHGKQGKVTFPSGDVARVISWSIDAVCGLAEATCMSNVAVAASTHWKTHTAMYKSWKAVIECIEDHNTHRPNLETEFIDEDGQALVFFCGVTAEGTRKFSGNAIITNMTYTVDKDDVAKLSVEVQGTGSLTEDAA